MGESTNAILVWGVITEDGSKEHYDLKKIVENLAEPEASPIAMAELHQAGFEVVLHCSYSSPLFLLTLQGTKTTAWRGQPKAFQEKLVPEGAQKKLDRVLELLKWTPEEGSWILCSMWGC